MAIPIFSKLASNQKRNRFQFANPQAPPQMMQEWMDGLGLDEGNQGQAQMAQGVANIGAGIFAGKKENALTPDTQTWSPEDTGMVRQQGLGGGIKSATPDYGLDEPPPAFNTQQPIIDNGAVVVTPQNSGQPLIEDGAIAVQPTDQPVSTFGLPLQTGISQRPLLPKPQSPQLQDTMNYLRENQQNMMPVEDGGQSVMVTPQNSGGFAVGGDPVTTIDQPLQTEITPKPLLPMPEMGKVQGRGMAQVPQQAELTGTRKTKQELDELEKAPLQRRKSKWARIGTGIRDAVMNWAEAGMPGGLGGIVGAMGVGGIGSLASPNFNAELTKGRKKSGLMRKYEEGRKMETSEAERVQEIAKTDRSVTDAAKARDDAKYNRAKPYLDSIEKKGYFTPEEVQHVKEVYGLDMTDPNNGRFEEIEVEGKRQIRRSNSPVYVDNPTARTDRSKVLYNTNIDGTQLPLTASQAASTKVGVAQANVGRTIAAENRETARTQKVADDEQNFNQQRQTEVDKARAKYNGAAKEKSGYELDLAENSGDMSTSEISALRGKIAKAEATMLEAETEQKSWEKRKYQKPKDAPATMTAKKAPSHEQAREYLKKKYPKWTDEQIEQRIKERLK